MKQYKVVTVKLPVQKQKELALEAILDYLEQKKQAGVTVEKILEYNDKQIQLLCSEDGIYHVDEDIMFDHLI